MIEKIGLELNLTIPLRITVGKKAGEDIVEYSTRKERENEDISSQEAIKRVVDIVKNLK